MRQPGSSRKHQRGRGAGCGPPCSPAARSQPWPAQCELLQNSCFTILCRLGIITAAGQAAASFSPHARQHSRQPRPAGGWRMHHSHRRMAPAVQAPQACDRAELQLASQPGWQGCTVNLTFRAMVSRVPAHAGKGSPGQAGHVPKSMNQDARRKAFSKESQPGRQAGGGRALTETHSRSRAHAGRWSGRRQCPPRRGRCWRGRARRAPPWRPPAALQPGGVTALPAARCHCPACRRVQPSNSGGLSCQLCTPCAALAPSCSTAAGGCHRTACHRVQPSKSGHWSVLCACAQP